MDVAAGTTTVKRNRIRLVFFAVMTLSALLSVQVDAAQNLLVNGDFSKGSDNRPAGWRTETWIDLQTTTFSWIPPFGSDSGEVEISNDKLNDSRWVQSTTLSPGLYYAGVEIFTHGVPVQSWAGALISIGDQGVASLDLKGNGNWSKREVFFTVGRQHTKVDVKLRLAGFLNFALGQAFFRNAVLFKIDRAPEGALVLDLDNTQRLWAGSRWTLVPIGLLLVAAILIGWRLLDIPAGDETFVR